jgi:glycerol-3-phosphate dehydrogenase (NAD(P)+)
MTRVSIIGATTWGNTLASLISANGADVRVWAKTPEQASALQNKFKGQGSGSIEFSADPDFTTEGCEAAVFAVPAQSVRRSARLFANKISNSSILASAAKGLEASSGKRMTEILAEEAGRAGAAGLAVISGPNLSGEINSGLPAVTVIASEGNGYAQELASLMASSRFSVYTSSDVKGVEICGALKNVIALGAGMSDGLKLGSNAKAALVTVGWQEVIGLGRKLGADDQTFLGFAGLGDLVTTCISPLSRNYHAGYELAGGKTLAEVLGSMSNVVEGVDTTRATHLLSSKLGYKMPLMDAIYRVLAGELDAEGIKRYFLNGHKSSLA